MKTDPEEIARNRARLASSEGYASLAILASILIWPQVDHPSTGEVITRSIVASIAFGLALGGVRFGRGGGRAAAWVALELVSLWLALILIASLERWDRVVWYWSR